MSVTHYGFVRIRVPQGNLYDATSIRNRVFPHLRQLGGEPWRLEEVDGEPSTYVFRLDVSGDWWSDAYERWDTLQNVLTSHYGFEIVKKEDTPNANL